MAKKNPDKVVYNYLRFSDFAAQRRNSTLVKKVKADGLFKSVKEATQQVEEIRMLAERGIFLGTRMPLLTGNFAEVWMSQLLVSPETKKILDDIHTFSSVSERLALVAEQMPDKIIKDVSMMQDQIINQAMTNMNRWSDVTLEKVMARVSIEREAFIDQFMNRLWGERKNALEAIMKEEHRISELVAEVRKMIVGSNNLLLSVITLSEKFNANQPSAEPKNSKPFDIQKYHAAIAEVTTLVESTNRLFATADLEKLLPQVVDVIDRVEGEGEELVDHSFRQALILILIAMGAYVVARLIYNFLNQRLIRSQK